jgi:tRNA (cytidine/uridine-2'-O-)-methyltransferase
MGFKIDDAKLKRAGLDYWHMLDVTYYENVDDFFARTSGHYYYLTTKGSSAYTDIRYEGNVYVIFGREDAGLPATLRDANPERCLRIPMKDAARSLNLSNSVAIVAFEALRQWGFPELN